MVYTYSLSFMPAPADFSTAIMRTTMSKSMPKSESNSKSASGQAGDARSPPLEMEMTVHDRDLEFPPLDLGDDFFFSVYTNPDTDIAIQSAWPPTPPPHVQAASDVDPRWSSSPSQWPVQMPPQHPLQLQGTLPLPPVDKVRVDALTAALALAVRLCDPSDVQTDHLVMPFRLPYNFGHLPLPAGCLPQHLFGADQLVQVGTTLFSVIQQALSASSHEHSPTHARDLIRAVNALPTPPELHQQLLAQSLSLCNVFLDGAAASSHNHQAPLLLQQQLGHLARAWVETQLTRVSDIPSSIDQVQAQASRHDLPGWPLALLRQEQPSQALCLVLLLTQPLPPPSPLLSEPAPCVPDMQQPQYTQQPSPALSSSSMDHMQLTPPQPQANMTDQAMATAVGDQRTFPSPLSPTASTSGAVAPRPPPPPAYRRRRRYPDDFERQMKDFHVAIRKALEGQGHIPLKLLNTRFPLIFAHHTNSLIMHPTSRRELADMLYTTLHDFSLSDKQRDLIYAWKGCNRNPLMPFQFLRRMLQERIDRATRRSGPVLKDVTDFKLPRHRALVTDVLGDLVLEWCEWNWNVFGGDAVEPRPHTGLSLVRHGDGSGVALIICIMDADGKPTVPLKMQLAMEDQARRKESKKLKANEARRRRRSAKASGDQGRTSRRSSWSSRADRDCTIRFSDDDVDDDDASDDGVQDGAGDANAFGSATGTDGAAASQYQNVAMGGSACVPQAYEHAAASRIVIHGRRKFPVTATDPYGIGMNVDLCDATSARTTTVAATSPAVTSASSSTWIQAPSLLMPGPTTQARGHTDSTASSETGSCGYASSPSDHCTRTSRNRNPRSASRPARPAALDQRHPHRNLPGDQQRDQYRSLDTPKTPVSTSSASSLISVAPLDFGSSESPPALAMPEPASSAAQASACFPVATPLDQATVSSAMEQTMLRLRQTMAQQQGLVATAVSGSVGWDSQPSPYIDMSMPAVTYCETPVPFVNQSSTTLAMDSAALVPQPPSAVPPPRVLTFGPAQQVFHGLQRTRVSSVLSEPSLTQPPLLKGTLATEDPQIVAPTRDPVTSVVLPPPAGVAMGVGSVPASALTTPAHPASVKGARVPIAPHDPTATTGFSQVAMASIMVAQGPAAPVDVPQRPPSTVSSVSASAASVPTPAPTPVITTSGSGRASAAPTPAPVSAPSAVPATAADPTATPPTAAAFGHASAAANANQPTKANSARLLVKLFKKRKCTGAQMAAARQYLSALTDQSALTDDQAVDFVLALCDTEGDLVHDSQAVRVLAHVYLQAGCEGKVLNEAKDFAAEAINGGMSEEEAVEFVLCAVIAV